MAAPVKRRQNIYRAKRPNAAREMGGVEPFATARRNGPRSAHKHVRGLSHKACAATNLHDEPVELEIKVRALHAPGPGVLHDLRVVAGVDHDPDHKRRVAQCAAAQEDVLVVERDVLLLSLVLHRPTEALEIGVREFKGDVALEVLDGFHEVVFLDLFEDVGLGGLSLQIGSLSRSAVSR